MGYKLSYTTGLLHAWSSCMLWPVWVWTVGHWVVLVQVIYCFKGGWVLFLKNQLHPWGENLSYSRSRKPDLSATHSSPFSIWLSVIYFFPQPLKPHCHDRVTSFVGGDGKIAMQLPYPHLLCIVLLTSNSLRIFFILFYMLSGCAVCRILSVALSCCAGARCLGPEGWLHTYEMVMHHFANPNFSVIVGKCWF